MLTAPVVADDIAFDLVDSTSANLTSYENAFTDAFGSPGDGFQVYRRGVSASIPFALIDDSGGSFPLDTLGIVTDADTAAFFGIVDTVNGDNAGEVSATWTFAIDGAEGLELSIGMAAMGDFEASDGFVWEYAIDGGPSTTAFSGTTDESATQSYTLAGGGMFTLNDPMTVQGTTLTNAFGEFVAPIGGTGSALTLTLRATFNGGDEAVAFRDIVIRDGAAPPPPVAVREIFEIQGSGPDSPFDGESVVTRDNIVTAVFASGFYLQTPDDRADADPATSDGIFVFTGDAPTVVPGDLVDVSAVVDEFFGLTELRDVSELRVTASGAEVTPRDITLPLASLDEWESVEGMRVRFPQPLYVTGNFTLGRFGELDLSVDSPLDNPTNIVEPGALAAMLQTLNDLSRIQLDDGSSAQNPEPLPPYFDASGTRRTGDRVDALEGVLSYAFGAYEVLPVGAVDFERANARPIAAPEVGGSLRLAAFNVLNYFITLDGSGSICGPAGDQSCRGADSPAELELQRAKLITAIGKLDADVVGLIEIENAPGDAPTADLVAGLNAASSVVYDYVATGAIGDDAIRVGLIYDTAKVRPVGDFAVLDESFDAEFDTTRNRPALAQTFAELGTDDTVTVVVNHLKSKGSPCDSTGDVDTGDGQGNCNLTRTAAARVLAEWLATDPTSSGETDPAYLILGDLNAYAQEDPIVALENAGYVDLIEKLVGEGWEEGAYSFNFRGQSGYLDHALANDALERRLTGAAIWHINADEPAALDYNDFNQTALAVPDEFRSSDHDPVIVGLCETTPPVVTVALSDEVLWPPNRRYADVTADVRVEDADAGTTLELLGVGSSEPDASGGTTDDIVIVDQSSFRLRRERSARGDGRVYTIAYRATDGCGNASDVEATVTVPKSLGRR